MDVKPKIVEITWEDPTFFLTEGNRPNQCTEYTAYGILQETENYYFLDCGFPTTDESYGMKYIGFIIPKESVKKITVLKRSEGEE